MWVTETPRSAIMITRSRKLSLKLVYQLHAQNGNLSVEVTSFEQILDRDERVHLFIIARHPRVCTRAVQGIVRGFGGSIHVASEPGKGTTFQLLLPCAETTAGATSPPMPGAGESARPSQELTVLVVEDEDPLRQAVVKMLRKTGFAVLEAANGSAAIDLLRANEGKIDVILLDMTMPGPSSDEIVAEAAKAKRDIRVILTSAYSQEMIASSMSAPQIHSFIRKPFQFGDLLKTLRNALSS